MNETEHLEETQVMDIAQSTHNIILYNDNKNSFGFVMNALEKICDHTPEQAEQCTMLVHFKGKFPVKQGSYEDLRAINFKLVNIGLKSKIE
jgi:ATP-dependent Clp protease adaptor protein ClpS